jgi:hypothetical protein
MNYKLYFSGSVGLPGGHKKSPHHLPKGRHSRQQGHSGTVKGQNVYEYLEGQGRGKLKDNGIVKARNS